MSKMKCSWGKLKLIYRSIIETRGEKLVKTSRYVRFGGGVNDIEAPTHNAKHIRIYLGCPLLEYS